MPTPNTNKEKRKFWEILGVLIALGSFFVVAVESAIKVWDWGAGSETKLVMPQTITFIKSKCESKISVCLKISAPMNYYNEGEVGYDDILLEETARIEFTPIQKGVKRPIPITLRASEYVLVIDPKISKECPAYTGRFLSEWDSDERKIPVCQVSEIAPKQIPAGGVSTHETLFGPWPVKKSEVVEVTGDEATWRGEETNQNYIKWEKFKEYVDSHVEGDEKKKNYSIKVVFLSKYASRENSLVECLIRPRNSKKGYFISSCYEDASEI